MKHTFLFIALLLLFSIPTAYGQTSPDSSSQTVSASNFLIAQPIPDRDVFYTVSDEGKYLPMSWGADLAWAHEANFRRCLAFMGKENVDIVRSSFQPTHPLVNGDLQTPQINALNERLRIIAFCDPHTQIVLNDDHVSVDASYLGNAANWANLIEATAKRHVAAGRKVVSVSPFNEPDFGWGQGTQQDFLNICTELRKKTYFDSIRISGGNTLNCDQALPWYNFLKSKLDEGNTHQLAGNFDNFATFYQTVRANGDHATGDELHNIMESMVGSEYGMQTGIWWGPAELARGEFAKSTKGRRLGYAEHRANWTAASVYRQPNGKLEAFGGTSERQAVTTTFRYISKDRDVYYNGQGPQREFTLVMPGGTGYQKGQTNAECVVNITYGDDIQPVINGRYILVNKRSWKALEIMLGNSANGTNIVQRTYSGKEYQQWDVTPVSSRIGGDFSYYSFKSVATGKAPDVNNFSMDNGGNVQEWDDNSNVNQQWYLEYAGDGYFYIRNRHSSKCMEVANGSFLDGANVQQWDIDGDQNQLWRLIPVDAPVEFKAPAPPTNLTASSNLSSVRLDWSASTDADVKGYHIYRSDSESGTYNTIARDITSTSFVDNTAEQGKNYFYALKAVDQSLNRSAYSTKIQVAVSSEKGLIMDLGFNGNSLDTTLNLNHGAIYGTVGYSDGNMGNKALTLNGTANYVALPATVANYEEMTISCWVYWKGLTTWQRIFDFGNGTDAYMFLTPRNSNNQMRFAIKNGGSEQVLNTTSMSYYKWTHVAVTLAKDGVKLYVNGVLAAESSAISIRPSDFRPVLNYIGRSQFADPLFNGLIDDFRIYNTALRADQIAWMSTDLEDKTIRLEGNLTLAPVPASDILHVSYCYPAKNTMISLLDANGRTLLTQKAVNTGTTDLNVSDLSNGIYLLKITNEGESQVKRIVVKH